MLLLVIGFRAYAVWTGESGTAEDDPIDPRDLLRGDFVAVEYRISTIDLDKVAQDDAYGGRGRGHAFAGTVLGRGDIERYYGSDEGACPVTTSSASTTASSAIFVPEGSGGDLPSGRESCHRRRVESRPLRKRWPAPLLRRRVSPSTYGAASRASRER